MSITPRFFRYARVTEVFIAAAPVYIRLRTMNMGRMAKTVLSGFPVKVQEGVCRSFKARIGGGVSQRVWATILHQGFGVETSL